MRVFASLANGTLCIFSRKSISSFEPGPIGDANCIAEACTVKCSDEQFRAEAEDWANPLIMRLGEGKRAAKCMTFVGKDQLWCGCGKHHHRGEQSGDESHPPHAGVCPEDGPC